MAQIHETRRQMLRQYIGQFEKDREAAEKLNISPGQLSQLKMDPTGKGARNMGDKLARRMEKAAGLPRFYFDGVELVALRPEEIDLLRRFNNVSAADQKAAYNWLGTRRMTPDIPAEDMPIQADPSLVEEYFDTISK